MGSWLDRWKDQGIVSDSAAAKLGRFADLIVLWNPRINLTGYKRQAEVEELLLGESIAALSAVRLEAGCRVLDFGSGAGVPGLVWAICVPEARVTSLESRQKKVNFQKEVLRELQVSAEVVHGRFPEAVAGREYDLVASRAIRFDPSLWGKGQALLAPKGRFVRFASAPAPQPEAGWTATRVSDRTTVLIGR
jgi:16S rRNA (guanine527-N7)-methyltransferase